MCEELSTTQFDYPTHLGALNNSEATSKQHVYDAKRDAVLEKRKIQFNARIKKFRLKNFYTKMS